MSDRTVTAGATDPWPFWKRYLNLAQPRLGAETVGCSDEFFGAANRLIDPKPPVFLPGEYDDHGKWMDGWETRRKREVGHDWCIVRLGAPARVHGVDIDTAHFDGNQPQSATLDAWCAPTDSEASSASDCPPSDSADWQELLPRVELGPNASHRHSIDDPRSVTHLRLNIFPDGGVARLRVYGVPCHDWPTRLGREPDRRIDLAAALEGGWIVAASDEHFGAASNLLLPGRGLNMGDGWETARRRGPGADWVVIALGCAGEIEELEVDTAHFKGNYPHRCSVQASFETGLGDRIASGDLAVLSGSWPVLLEESLLRADEIHRFACSEVAGIRRFSHVRLNMIPDGGISRLRVIGRPRPAAD